MIPAQTNRLHLEPYWLGDSPRAVRKAGLRAPGRRFIDVNFQACLDDVIALHWGTAIQNGYTYLQVAPGKRRKMTKAELHRPIARWKSADVQKWRRTAKAGVSYASRIRPYTFGQMCTYARRWNVTICAELKSRSFGTNPKWAVYMRRIADQRKAKVYAMTLVTMVYWAQKMKNFKAAGFETALLAHSARKPAGFNQHAAGIDRVWGRFR
jgi:hypothetical protein